MQKFVKRGLISSCVCIFGILLGWAIFPGLLGVMLKREMALRQGTDLRIWWTKFPFQIFVKLYLFNYTNHLDIMKGIKPHVQEIGPYAYDLWKEKVNMFDTEEEDTITYNRRDYFMFNKADSASGLTGEEEIYTPNPVLIALAEGTARMKPAMLDVALKAADGIFSNPDSIFMKVKVSDLLFRGVDVNCDQVDFAPKTVCTVLKREKSFEIHDNDQLRYSFFGWKNGTIEEQKFKVLRGMKNLMDVGKVVEYDGKTAQSMWPGPECNSFANGTDGTVFPPLIDNEDILPFTPELCRTLPAWYVSKSKYVGIPTKRYTTNFGDLANQPKDYCYCDTPDTCPRKGLMDLTKCVKLPVMVSLPHYLHTDPSVQKSIKGFFPDESKHDIVIDVEPVSGTPLFAKKRIQFNIKTPKLANTRLFSNFAPDLMLPIFWYEEGVVLNKTYTNMLKLQLVYPTIGIYVISWSCIFGGLGVLVHTAYGKYKQHFVNVTSEENEQKKSSSATSESDNKIIVNTIENTT